MFRFSAKVAVSTALGVLLVTALWMTAKGSEPRSRLLGSSEKKSILAADGGNPPCGYVVQMPCASFNGSGNWVGCALHKYPSCYGDCTNACANTNQQSWQCPSGSEPPYQCPTLIANDPPQPCGFVTIGGSCVGSGGNCYCSGGNNVNPPQSCGNANLQPTPPYAACPPGGS